jgi:hypothetical protein
MLDDSISQQEITWPRYPYPGLRPFRSNERLIFRGRSRNSDDVLERLDRSQFVSIVGPSGCGKSSLVKVGVIPVLKGGLLTRAGYEWEAIEMRPGQDPVTNLAEALAQLNGSEPGPSGMDTAEIAQLLATRRSGLWMVMEQLADHLQSAGPAAKPRRVLLLLDQFEEVFSGVADHRPVNLFIDLIIQIFRSPHPQLYIVLTMRTDFINQCANFPGLAEILNKTQYITPVLRGQELAAAIVEPAEIYGGEVEPDLVAAIMNDMGSGSDYHADHLPLMQHALLWLWEQAWRATGQPEPPRPQQNSPDRAPTLRLTLQHYVENGGLKGILNRHAEAIFEQVSTGAGGDRRAAILEVMFRRLSERDARARYKRAPTLAQEICQLAQCTPAELDELIEPFADGDASFIERRPRQEPENPLIDLSHESLIRQWDRLRAWADAEADKLQTLRKYVEDAETWIRSGKSRARLKGGLQLDSMRDWWRQSKPTDVWAARYVRSEGNSAPLADGLPLVQAFETASVRDRNRGKHIFWIATASALAAVITVVIFQWQSRIREIQAVRVGLVQLLSQSKLDDGQPEKALQVILSFLTSPRHGGDLSPVVASADQALHALHEVRRIKGSGLIFSVDYSPDGKWLSVAGFYRNPLILDLAQFNATPLPEFDGMSFVRMQWNPAHKDPGLRQLVLSASDRSALLLPVDTAGPVPQFDVERSIRLGENDLGVGTKVGTSIFSGDGRRVVTGGQGAPLRVFDAVDGKLLAAQRGGGLETYTLASNVDASLLAVPGAKSGVELYAVKGKSKGTSIELLPAFREPPPRGRSERLQEGGQEGEGQHCTASLGAVAVHALAFHPTDPNLLVFTDRCRVLGVNVRTGKWLFELVGSTSELYKVTFNSDGTRIAISALDGTIAFYDVPPYDSEAMHDVVRDRLLVFLGKHDSSVYDERFSPDGRFLASGDRNGAVQFWSIAPVLPPDKHIADDSEFSAFMQQNPLPEGIEALNHLDHCISDLSECDASALPK